jgi:hypothetical protein
MMPMGRYGPFAGNDYEKAEELSDKYNVDIKEPEIGVEWVTEYFQSPDNPWRANTRRIKRRTQQEPEKLKPQVRNYQLEFADLQGYEPMFLAMENRDQDVEFIYEGMQEFLDILLVAPIELFMQMNPGKVNKSAQASLGLGYIYQRASSLRREEIDAYTRSLERTKRKLLKEQQIEINKWKRAHKQKKIADEGYSKQRAGREANEYVRLVKKYNQGIFDAEKADNEDYMEELIARDSGNTEQEKKGINQNFKVIKSNPKLDRVLPLLERVEELDTLFLELEQEYAEIQSRRLRR